MLNTFTTDVAGILWDDSDDTDKIIINNGLNSSLANFSDLTRHSSVA